MSLLESLEKTAVPSESEMLAEASFSLDLYDALNGKIELLDPWTHFAILNYEAENPVYH